MFIIYRSYSLLAPGVTVIVNFFVHVRDIETSKDEERITALRVRLWRLRGGWRWRSLRAAPDLGSDQ